MIEKYEYRIWLEIHIKLNSINKLFCQCKNEQEFDDLQANTNVCPVCMGQPGALPVLNKEPLEKAILLGHALKCQVNEFSAFDRKSYFYPDLPAGFQITQLPFPTNWNGLVNFFINNFEDEVEIKIERAHIENDAGKTIHEWWKWILDYNRAGTPLVEIVTFPDFTSDEEVVEFLKELQRIARYNNIWFADLERWQMRVDVNISVRKKWETKLGTKVEVKNMNSFWSIKRAIEFEFERQVELIEKWWSVDQETRWRDDAQKLSYTMRSKEDSLDYRYFPEPDLPKLKLEKDYIDEIKQRLVESPYSRIKRYKEEYKFNKEYINSLISSHDINDYFEYMVQNWIDYALAAKWIVGSVLRFLSDAGTTIADLKFTKEQFISFLKLIQDGKLMDSHAKQVLFEMKDTGKNPEKIIEEKWLKPIDNSEIESIVQQVLNDNPNAVEDFKNGKMNAVGFLVGQVMKKSAGKADPKTAKELIEKALSLL